MPAGVDNSTNWPLTTRKTVPVIILLIFTALHPPLTSAEPRTQPISDNQWAPELKFGIVLPYNQEYQFNMRNVYPAIVIASETIRKQSYLSGAIKSIRLTEADSRCSETYGPLAAIDMYKKGEANVFFGPACDLAVSHVAQYSRRWNTPVLSAGGSVSEMDDKQEFGLLTRMQTTYTEFSRAFEIIIERFKWKNVGFLCDKRISDCYHNLYALFKMVERRDKTVKFHKYFEGFDSKVMEDHLKEAPMLVRSKYAVFEFQRNVILCDC